MSRPLISIIIPTFNRAYCLPRTVDSVLGQTYADLEVIIVDDGSSDGTEKLISARYSPDRRIRYVRQENKGVSAARNHGIRLSHGDYVAFLDSDDVWMSWKLELQLACMNYQPNVGMVWTDMDAVDPHGNILHKKYLRTMYGAYRWFKADKLFHRSRPLIEILSDSEGIAGSSLFYWGDIFSPIIMGNLVHTSTVLLRRERLEKVKAFDESLRYAGEDYDFHLRTSREGDVGFIDLAAIHYRVGMDDQLTHEQYAIHIAQNFLRTIQPVIEKERPRIHLPERMIRAVMAEAYAWIGEEQIKLGQTSEGRKNLFESFEYQKWQPKTLFLLFLSAIPPIIRRGLKRMISVVARILR